MVFLETEDRNLRNGNFWVIWVMKVSIGKTRKMREICSKVTIKHLNDANDFVLVSLILILNIFHAFFSVLLLTLDR